MLVKRYMNLMSFTVFAQCLLLLSVNAVFAEPYLQLDADPSTYEYGLVYGTDESILVTEPEFTLYALVNSTHPDAPDDFEEIPPDLGGVGTFYISGALIPSQDQTDPTLGSIFFAGEQIFVVGGMVYGTPPIEVMLQQKDLQSHGVFETYFFERSFELDANKRAALYDSQYNPGGPLPVVADGPLYFQDFEVDIGGLSSGYAIHFDLYTVTVDTGGNPIIDEFAPFSHDLTAVPVPASVIIGILGLGVAGLKLRKFA